MREAWGAMAQRRGITLNWEAEYDFMQESLSKLTSELRVRLIRLIRPTSKTA